MYISNCVTLLCDLSARGFKRQACLLLKYRAKQTMKLMGHACYKIEWYEKILKIILFLWFMASSFAKGFYLCLNLGRDNGKHNHNNTPRDFSSTSLKAAKRAWLKAGGNLAGSKCTFPPDLKSFQGHFPVSLSHSHLHPSLVTFFPSVILVRPFEWAGIFRGW